MSLQERSIHTEIIVPATVEAVWDAWTTEAGVRTFFAPQARVEPYPGGAYEMYFNPEAPEGARGGEGLQVLAMQHLQMFSFTWNAPPNLPEVRPHRTVVVMRFVETAEGRTQVSLHHSGWGTGEQWDQAFAYFQAAWHQVILPRLKYRFVEGPVAWAAPPSMETLAKMRALRPS